MHRLRRCFAGLVVVVLGAGCGLQLNVGTSTRQQQVALFSRVAARGDVEVRLVGGALSEVVVTADARDLHLVEVRVENDELIVEHSGGEAKAQPLIPLKVEVHVPSLAEVSASSGAQVTLTEMKRQGALTLAASAAADINCVGLEVAALRVTAHDAGGVSLSGVVETEVLTATSDGFIDATDVRAQTSRVSAKARAEVHVTASQAIQIDARDGSRVRVAGSPPSRDLTVDDASQVEWSAE